MTYEPLIDFEDDYEICNEYPYHIRRIGTDKDISFNTYDRYGYIQVKLNGTKQLLHRLVAKQFKPNDDPEHLTEVDHINHIRDDNHLDNLRWVSHSDNNRNKTSNNDIEYTYISYEDEPEDLIIVTDYGTHQFEDYYYSPELNQFFFDTGEALRQLHVNYTKAGSAFVCARDTDDKRAKIMFTKFKKVYGLD